jgi:hypothetical protein
MGYFVLGWLPAYTVARLGLGSVYVRGYPGHSPLTWNVRDALKLRRWRLRPEDLVIPLLTAARRGQPKGSQNAERSV